RRADSVSLESLRHQAFDLNLDLDFFSDQHTAGLEGLIPIETKVLSVESGRGCEARAVIAPRILALTEERDIENDRLLYAVHLEHAIQFASFLGGVDVLNTSTVKRDLRIFLDVEEILRLQMGVALVEIGVDAGRFDAALHLGVGRRIGIEGYAALELVETTLH